MPDRSSPREAQYLFQYHVRISNVGAETAQLISREWIITNADGEVERVKGPGVVGEQPVLPPGGSFEYTSFCPLKTPVGVDARQLPDGDDRTATGSTPSSRRSRSRCPSADVAAT